VALAVVDVGAILASAVIGVGMALSGYGYWALVGMAISMPAMAAAGVWIALPWVPGMPRRGLGIRSMFHLGGTWTFVGLVSYAAYNLEKVLLGRYWGAVPLGLYGRAYQLVSLPTELMNSMGAVVVSALSRLQHDPGKLRRAFLASYSLIVSLTIPVTFVCALSAEEIVVIVLGPGWMESAALLRALAPTTLAFALMYPFAWFLASTARNRISIGTTLLVPPAVIAGIVVGLRYGPLGVAIGYSIGVSLVAVPVIAWCRSAIQTSFRDLWEEIRRPCWAGLLAFACGGAVKAFLVEGVSPFLALVAEVSVISGVYTWTLLIVFGRKAYYVDLLKSTLGGAHAGRTPSRWI
jgi:PST family polysaccharide transporter